MAARKTMVGTIDPDVLEFTAGKDAVLDVALVEVDCIGSAAHATMLSRLPAEYSLFSTEERQAVIAELTAIMRASRKGKFRITAQDQDVHLAVERWLTRKLGDAGKRIHTARSRNDQVALDLRLYAKEELLALTAEAAELARELLVFGKRHAKLPMVGRTHLQPAMPSSVGLWASAHAEGLLDDLTLVDAAYRFNDQCPLGSAAGYGVPVPIDRALTSKLLAFRAPHHNVLYASNSRGKCESVILSSLSHVMVSVSRLAEDLILYSMPEFGYFSIPKAYCTGSSIMPQKYNPDVLELVRARASRVQGAAVAAAGILKALPGGYNRDLQEMKEPFMDALQVTRAVLRIMAKLVRGLRANRKALLDGFTPDVFAADRALELVAEGMPFRDAYNYVREHLHELSDADPREAIAKKVHLGGTAGLDFGQLTAKTKDALAFVKRERRRYYAAISRLLGVRYLELED